MKEVALKKKVKTPYDRVSLRLSFGVCFLMSVKESSSFRTPLGESHLTRTLAASHLREPPWPGEATWEPKWGQKRGVIAQATEASLEPKQKASWCLSQVPTYHEWGSNKGVGSQTSERKKMVTFGLPGIVRVHIISLRNLVLSREVSVLMENSWLKIEIVRIWVISVSFYF